MNVRRRKRKKLIHEGIYVAEVEIELIDTDGGWSPYLSLEDALKLDEVREALRNKDFETASRFAQIYTLTPLKNATPQKSTSAV